MLNASNDDDWARYTALARQLPERRIWSARMGPMDNWPDDKIERLRAELRALSQALVDIDFAEIVARIDEHQTIPVGDQYCVLIGFEGQIDTVFRVPEPRPHVLRRPIEPKLRVADFDEGPTSPSFRVAEYDRVGEFTYRRTR